MRTLFYLAILGLLCGCDHSVESRHQIIKPKTMQKIEPITEETPQRVADLTAVAIALERYKLDYRSYPISSNFGKGWDSIHAKAGESKENWIAGLVPKYLPSLPRDPRMLTAPNRQYIYRSDGANYKLLTHTPDDCEEIKIKYPDLIDKKRDCWAYGYWTMRATDW